MARKYEYGLKYFSHDTDMCNDTKVRRLICRYQAVGYSTYCRLLEIIYKQGHYVKYDDDLVFDISSSLGYNDGEGQIRDAISFCVEVGLFDKGLFDGEQVLTSREIQERYFFAKVKSVKRAIKTNSATEYPYLLIDYLELLPKQSETKEVVEETIEVVEVKEVQKPKRKAADLSFVDARFRETFERWLTYKRERRENYKTDDSLQTCYRKLIRLSNGDPAVAQQIIEESISNNWQGFFALKNKTTYGGTQQNSEIGNLAIGIGEILASRSKK